MEKIGNIFDEDDIDEKKLNQKKVVKKTKKKNNDKDNNKEEKKDSNKKKISSKKGNTKIEKKEKELQKKKQVSKKVIDPEKEVVYHRKKRKVKKKAVISLFIILIIGIFISILSIKKYYEIKKNEEIKLNQEMLIKEIGKHYNKYVVVKKDTILYRIDDNNNYYEYGMVYQNVEISLEELEITHLTKYFYSSDLESYIKYEDLKPIDELTVYSDRYKNYIAFNQNIVTNDEFTLYDNNNNNNKIYSFKESMSFPIIIKNDDGKYYVEFNNRLLYILKDDIKEFINVKNTTKNSAKKITTLCYHRVYDTNEKCNDLYICKKKSTFDKEMKYLKDNNFLTLTMNEMYLYLSKKLQIPQKSVVLTFDDGYLFGSAIEVLEKYNLHGTGFLKTKYFDDLSSFASDNFELQSHTHDLHTAGTCAKETAYQQGGGILCLNDNVIMNDLKTSRDKLNGAIALAYPFYDYNNRAINLVQKAGFKLAFIGSNSVYGRSYPGINLYKVPRMTMWDTTSFTTFKEYVNN